MSILDRAIDEKVPYWICPDCKTVYFNVIGGPMRFCPHCKAEKDRLEKDYWDKKMAISKSIANDIVAQILAGVHNGK